MFSGPSAEVLSERNFDREGDTSCVESSFQKHNMKAKHSSHICENTNAQASAAACCAVQGAEYVVVCLQLIAMNFFVLVYRPSISDYIDVRAPRACRRCLCQ